MPSVKQRAADYEAMLASKSASKTSTSIDPLKDPLVAASSGPATAAPTSRTELTKEQSLEWQIAIRQTYEGPQDLVKFPEWMRPMLVESDASEDTDVDEALEESQAKQTSAPDPVSAVKKEAPPASGTSSSASAMDANATWAGVSPSSRIMAAQPDVEIRSSDVFAMVNIVAQAASMLGSLPGHQGPAAAAMSQIGNLTSIGSDLVGLETEAKIPDVDKRLQHNRRTTVLGRLTAIMGLLSGLLASTPAGPQARQFMGWAQARMAANATAQAKLYSQR